MLRRSDEGGRCVHLDRSWRRFIGSRSGAGGDDDLWKSVVHAEDLESCLEILAGAFEAQEAVSLDYRARRADGAVRRLQEITWPLTDVEGLPEGFGHAALDVTEIRGDNEILKRQLEQERLLLEDARHRLRRDLQLIASLFRMQTRRTANAEVREALENALRRIDAIMLIEQQVDQAEVPATVRLDTYLRDLVKPLVGPLAERSVRMELDVASVELPADVALPLGLLVNEVLVNALEHAFPEGRTGSVRLLVMPADAHLKVLISDDGVGLPEAAVQPKDPTSGIGLIHGFGTQIGAQVLVERGSGTRYLISVPVRSRATSADMIAEPRQA